jgi:hypothetical protein
VGKRGWILLDPRAGEDDELYTEWWTCTFPGCDYGRILRSANFCPGCGKKIEWRPAPGAGPQGEG